MGSGRKMGLFDINIGVGNTDRVARENTTLPQPATQSTGGQYALFQFQESILSNYFWARSYKKNKRVKFGFQDTYELGLKSGSANSDSSTYATAKTSPAGTFKSFFNYEAGLAIVVRITNSADIGYTYYPYVHSSLTPDTKNYSKLRLRYSHFTGEVTFGGKQSYDFKYTHRKMYLGLSYTLLSHTYNRYGFDNPSDVKTNLLKLSIGHIF